MDYNKYIGLPYKDNGRDISGVDCWGLARLFYKQELDIELPDYSELYTGSQDPQVTQAIDTYKDTWDSAREGVPGDLCLFNIYGEPAHIGVYVGNRKFLHAREGRDSVVESLDSSQWSKRFVGFYKYTTKPASVQLSGVPHPLRTQVLYDWTVAGTTVSDLASFVKQKYTISDRLSSKLVILLDGVAIPQDMWDSTVLQQGQTVAYKCVAEGRNATRLLLTLAVVYVSVMYGPQIGKALATAAAPAGVAASASSVAAYTAAASMAINMAGMALVNAIAPVRMPGQNGDPGNPAALNLFTGASNQANRFGAIPVVLGKMRATGVLGATPYVDTLTDTSLLNLLVVWGFGPLKVDDICIGTNPIENYYNKKGDPDPEFAQDIPLPVTLYGNATDPNSPAEIAFNKLYGRDVEQQQSNVLLVNNAEDGNPWQNVVFAQDNTTAIDLAFTFPEGMRQLVVSGGDAGKIREATAGVEVQLRKKNANGTFPAWAPRPSYALGDYSALTPNSQQYTDVLTGANTIPIYGDDEGGFYSRPLYQWHTYALSDTGEIVKFSGAATETQDAEPSASLIQQNKNSAYSSLLGNDSETNTYKRIPVLPLNGYIKLYTVCEFNRQVVATINHLQNNIGYSGLGLTVTPITSGGSYDDEVITTGTRISIASGRISGLSSNQPVAGQSVQIFNTRANLPGVTQRSNSRFWGTFLNETGVWSANTATTPFDVTAPGVSFPYTGYYHVEASADDEGVVYVDSRQVVGIPQPGYRSTVSNLVYLEAGTYPVRVVGKNSGGGDAAIGCKITYTENGGLNNLPSPDTVLVFGTPGFYHKRKDAFNFVYRIKNLDPGVYEARVRRINDDTSEPEESLRNYNKVALLSATAYGNTLDANGRPQGPLNKIPNTNLARTAIRIQSTSKANGTVDGVNALVQSICLDWDRVSQRWIERATSNPASLFGYVLMHPGNAYRIKPADASQQIDIAELQKWHEYCDDNGFEFNSIVTQTQSVMDILRDICAAGKASPSYVDGKWTVIVDKPREYVTQHFTPHNSWGFESTKILPRLPDAFRVTFANREKAYQADEELVFNYGKNKNNAEIFEELSLPGVTNARQARHLARWHLAQTKLRPEVYTLNVDFEYLVCNRGDLVRVAHDVPLWGTGTGRIVAKSGSTLVLSEPVSLTAGTQYQIRIRTNTVSAQPGATNSTLLNLAPITTSGMVDTITLTAAVPVNVEADNLYMLGEVAQESQELVVLSVEPSDNLSARLTLADYSPQIYTLNMDSGGELPAFNANITGQSNQSVLNTITQAPIIAGATSSSGLAEEISTGTFQNVLILSFGNVPELSEAAQKIQVQIVLGDTDFSSGNLFGIYTIDKSAGSLSVTGLKTLTIYKVRARYTNATGTISGPWSATFYTTSTGKVDNTYVVQTLLLDLDTTFVTAVPTTDLNKPANFKTFEYRLFKDTGTEDFWELDVVSNNIQVIQTTATARFDLLKMPLPRLSEAGITYRVACRALDNNNNYSPESALGTIVVATIK